MSTLATSQRATIELLLHLEAPCRGRTCTDLADRMKKQLDTPKYSRGVSILAVPESREAWEAGHRTARKRAWRAERLGYRFAEVDMALFNDDRHEINTSKQERQGRPMSEGYLTKSTIGSLPPYTCQRHRIMTFGVLAGPKLRAYSTLYRVGDLALVSMILGHGDYLLDDIMYLLAAGMIENQAGQGGWFFYNRHDSGTEGLRYFKERLGFAETHVTWSLT